MGQDKPLVSILVRTKDRPKLLRNALKSVALQTYRPVEVVVVNDGGCDLPVEELKKILDGVSLNYIKVEKNRGRARAGNLAIKNAAGAYLGFLDDDDEFYPEHVGVLADVLEQLDFKIAYSDTILADLQYDPKNRELAKRNPRIFASRDFSRKELIIDNYIPLMSILFSRDVFDRLKGFDEEFDLYEDWDLLIRASKVFPFYHVRKATAEYLQWNVSSQIAQSSESVGIARTAHRQIIRKHKEEFTPDVMIDLVQNRRDLRTRDLKVMELEAAGADARKLLLEKDDTIDILETGARERDERIDVLEGGIRDRDGRLAEQDSRIAEKEARLRELTGTVEGLEAAMREKDSRIQNLSGRISDYERRLREKEAALSHIYNSNGWKALIKYYDFRDSLFPENSRVRSVMKLVVNGLRNPKNTLKNLNAVNVRKFFYYIRNASPSILDEKVNKKLGVSGSQDVAVTPAYNPERSEAHMEFPSEKVVLFLESADLNQGDNDLSRFRAALAEFLKDLDQESFEPVRMKDTEEYLKTNGARFSYVAGFGGQRCFDAFPFVRAYAPGSKVLYCLNELTPSTVKLETLNAAAADAIIVSSVELKKRLLQSDGSLRILLPEEIPALETVLAEGDERVSEEGLPGGGEVPPEDSAEDEKYVAAAECLKADENENGSAGGSVLVTGVYLVNQKNSIEHIVRQFNCSKKWNVRQQWIALGGEHLSEDVRRVTVKRVDERLPKVVLLNGILSNIDADSYDYVIICDDDILLPPDFVDTFLDMQRRYDFAAAQPARTHNSYIDHPFVEGMDGLKARRTRFVEIGPLVSFRHDILPFILPFDESTPMGWGFDFVLPCIAEEHGLRIGIIDKTRVDHSMRKPMQNYDYADVKKEMEDYLSRNAHLSRKEAFTILESYS
ncbi:MAG: glycosyltransferase [Candidatus Sulfobium sp.]|jgi:glycosyltransferase involved in cell wall biosynthesis